MDSSNRYACAWKTPHSFSTNANVNASNRRLVPSQMYFDRRTS